MKGMRITFKNSVVPMLLIASLFGVFFYFFFMNFGMAMNPDGSMGHCPFMSSGAICTMTFQEHMNTLQTMFTAVPQKLTTTAGLILLAFYMAFATLVFRRLLLKYTRLLFFDYRLYTKRYSYISLVDPAKRAIYEGLITPKIF